MKKFCNCIFSLHIFTVKALKRKPLVQSAGKLTFYQQDIDGNSDWLDENNPQTRLIVIG